MDTTRITRHLPPGLTALRALLAGFLAPTAASRARPATGTWGVDHGRIAFFERPAGLTFTCEQGTLWITFHGRTTDLVLHDGESHRCEAGDEGLVVSAAQPARFRVDGHSR